jgi:hypothetical protein
VVSRYTDCAIAGGGEDNIKVQVVSWKVGRTGLGSCLKAGSHVGGAEILGYCLRINAERIKLFEAHMYSSFSTEP